MEEIFELPVRDPTGINDNSMHVTVRELMNLKLFELQLMFKPVLFLHDFRIITQAHELINFNMRFALMRKRYRDCTEAAKEK